MLANFSPGHGLVLAAVMVLMLAGNKLPDAARSLGKSLRILKSALLPAGDKADKPAIPPTPSRWGGSPPLRTRLPIQTNTDA